MPRCLILINDLEGCHNTFANIVYVDIHQFFKHSVIDLMEEKLDTHLFFLENHSLLWPYKFSKCFVIEREGRGEKAELV